MSKTSPSALTRLFKKQKTTIKPNKNVANVLTSFAEDDYKRIAQLIQAWLEKDASPKQRKRLKHKE